MAGIYIHIPFCKQACSYCNFHFSTNLHTLDGVIKSICSELELRKEYLDGATIDSVYFGGGTPSLLSQKDLQVLFNAIGDHLTVAEAAEITLEANPDDLDKEKLSMLCDTPINRLSIGVQSFRPQDLVFMQRAHNAAQAHQCLEDALTAGFSNLSVDLIYGTPGLSDEAWLDNLKVLSSYGIHHWSCYALTVEEKTKLAHMISKNMMPSPKDEVVERHFKQLMDFAARSGFVHYEISNFAQPGYIALHNSNYWKQIPYLGLGPSAHSYNGFSRSWNVANNIAYINAITNNQWPGSTEDLTQHQKYNEYIMTGLRTQWGCSLTQIKLMGDLYHDAFLEGICQLSDQGWVEVNDGIYTLSDHGKLFADLIAGELFIV